MKNPLAIINIALSTVGFDSVGDLIRNSLRLNMKWISMHVASAVIAGFLALISSVLDIVDIYVYSPAKGIVLLGIVTTVNFFLGLGNSNISKGESIKVNKISRAFIRFFVQIVFVGIAFNLNLSWPFIIQVWVVDTFLLVFILTTMWSAIVNAHELKLITDEQFEILETFVNPLKIIERFKKKKEHEHEH